MRTKMIKLKELMNEGMLNETQWWMMVDHHLKVLKAGLVAADGKKIEALKENQAMKIVDNIETLMGSLEKHNIAKFKF